MRNLGKLYLSLDRQICSSQSIVIFIDVVVVHNMFDYAYLFRLCARRVGSVQDIFDNQVCTFLMLSLPMLLVMSANCCSICSQWPFVGWAGFHPNTSSIFKSQYLQLVPVMFFPFKIQHMKSSRTQSYLQETKIVARNRPSSWGSRHFRRHGNRGQWSLCWAGVMHSA